MILDPFGVLLGPAIVSLKKGGYIQAGYTWRGTGSGVGLARIDTTRAFWGLEQIWPFDGTGRGIDY